jgi:replicative DNA helicase
MNRPEPDAFAALIVPPHSIEAEQSLLGALLIDNGAYDRVMDIVRESDFYQQGHRILFRHLARMIESGRPADLVTLAESLDKEVEKTGGIAYLGELMQNSPGSTNVTRYADIVADRAKKRALMTICSNLIENAYSPSASPAAEIIDQAQEELFALSVRQGADSGTPIRQILAKVIERIDARYHSADDQGISGLSTGFVDLDDKTGGLEGGNLIVIAGRPSMGKTSLAMNIVEHVAIEQGKACLVLSLEMSDEEIAQRSLGSIARINQHALRSGRLSDDAWSRLSVALGKMSEAPIIIEETFDLSPANLRAKARRAHRERGKLGLIVVDYLQLMEAGAERRVDQIAEISRGLKRIAKELDVPVIALSQLNRQLENRPNKRPGMSDLRDSGAIEQDADMILFLYRESEYVSDCMNPDLTEVIIGKHRNGPTGTVNLRFIKEYTCFENWSGDILAPARRAPRSRAFSDEPRQHRVDVDG